MARGAPQSPQQRPHAGIKCFDTDTVGDDTVAGDGDVVDLKQLAEEAEQLTARIRVRTRTACRLVAVMSVQFHWILQPFVRLCAKTSTFLR